MRSAAKGRSSSRQSCTGVTRSTQHWSRSCQHTATIFSMENAEESSFTAESNPLAFAREGGRELT